MSDVEQQSTRGVSDVSCSFARQLKSHIVFGQHERANPVPVRGFVLPDPQAFGQREIGECGIAGELNETCGTDLRGQLLALLLGPDITPDQCRPYDAAVLVQQDGPVHLSGQTNARNLIAAQMACCQRRVHSHAARAPPVAWILLRPADPRRCKGSMLLGCGGNDTSSLIDDESARTSGAYVDPQKMHCRFARFLCALYNRSGAMHV